MTGLCIAAGLVLFMCFFISGTRLGRFYDFLSTFRPPVPVSTEIVLIETGEITENSDIYDVLQALGEFEAFGLVIGVPVLGSSSDRTLTDEEIRQRLYDEYALLARNIRNLFEAIRMGSIKPAETHYFVDNLVELADRGRDRLAAFLLRDTEYESILSARPDTAFTPVLEATDLRAYTPDARPWYSQPHPDPDGILRRIAPILPAENDAQPPVEHIVYKALKQRWAQSGIEDTEKGQILIAGDFRFPLDPYGNILIERPHDSDSFRSITIESFRLYTETDTGLRRLLKDAETLGAYAQLKPEQIPLYLYDYASGFRDDALKNPSAEKHAAWLQARHKYLDSLDEFLNGDSESKLTGAYNALITTENFTPDGRAKLEKLRDDLTVLFAEMKDKYRELTELRTELQTALYSSFCIMGPPYTESQLIEACALLANTLLTGRSISTGQQLFAMFCFLGSVFLLLFIIHAMRPLLILITGTLASAICAAGFGWSFILTGIWMDPQIPALACMSGTVLMFFIAFFTKRHAVRRFKTAYGSNVSKNCLKQLIKKGQPSLQSIHTAPAAVIAIKNSDVHSREDRDNPVNIAKAAANFRSDVMRIFLKAGAAYIGCEGDAVLVCFGSPLERLYQSQVKHRHGNNHYTQSSHPVIKAIGFITELIPNAPLSWHFGIDFGECAFSWSKETGFIANGQPLVRARILAGLALRNKARIFLTNTVREKVDRPARKLQVPGKKDTGAGEFFYELLMEK